MVKKIVILIMLLALLIPFVSCKISKEEMIAETIPATTEAAVQTDTVHEAETTVIDTTAEETKETAGNTKDKIAFWEAIVEGEKNYDITEKGLLYAMEVTDIAIAVLKENLSDDEKASRYLDLSSRVTKDFFISEIMIDGYLEEKGLSPNDEMKEIVSLITEWADKTNKRYHYYYQYLDTGQAEYEIKSDELEEEAKDISDRYFQLTISYAKAYNEANN